jgi:hypothetical protein
MQKIFFNLSRTKSSKREQETDNGKAKLERSRCNSTGEYVYNRSTHLKSGTTNSYRLRLNSSQLNKDKSSYTKVFDNSYRDQTTKDGRLNSLKRSMTNSYDQDDLMILKRNFLRPGNSILNFKSSRNFGESMLINDNADSSPSK